MKKSICFLVLFFISAIFTLNAQDKVKQFDKYVQESFKTWDIPSVAVAIVVDGEIVLEKAYGHTNWDKKNKANENTLYPIGSISKGFCTLSLAQLIQEGKITWNTKVKSLIPDFKLYNDYVTDNTVIEDLVSHRIGYGTFSGDLLWYHTNYSIEEIIPKLQYVEPVYDFRNGYGYSNIMFIVAEKVIEIVSGMDYEQYVKENIFNLLEMNRTTMEISVMQKQGNDAIGCYTSPSGEKLNCDFIPSINIKAFGGINSS
ncbi:MAG: serine hydrolase domain-containing protein, partial [Bacteroidota bacterium]|nr:serine hydrolase domain-containing protein [Bacteroidota bacterium]